MKTTTVERQGMPGKPKSLSKDPSAVITLRDEHIFPNVNIPSEGKYVFHYIEQMELSFINSSEKLLLFQSEGKCGDSWFEGQTGRRGNSKRGFFPQYLLLPNLNHNNFFIDRLTGWKWLHRCTKCDQSHEVKVSASDNLYINRELYYPQHQERREKHNIPF